MNQRDRTHLLSEIKFLKERLAELPESARITRISTESHVRAIEEQLAREPAGYPEPAKVTLTFNGRPVIASYGIFAEFGAAAAGRFNEAVTTMAASICAPLAAMGPIPKKEQNQLLIIGPAVGSFGFELEEYRQERALFDEISPVAQALERTQVLLQGMVGTDDQLADSAAETDPRALEKIRAFLQTLADNDAVCAMQYRDRVFRFEDVGQVRRSLARISQENLHEELQQIEGEFQGVLPKHRTFEFRLAKTQEVVTGRIGPGISNPDALNEHLHKPARIEVLTTRVGNGRPRYLLNQEPQWLAQGQS